MLWYLKSLSVRFFFVFSVVMVFLALFTNRSYAFSNTSDTVTTSRPSASSPLNANFVIGQTQLTIYNNGSRYLASDSAKILRTTNGALVVGGLAVASQSADLLTTFLGKAELTGAQAGTDVLITPVTTMHTIQFKTANAIANGESWVITFPQLASGDSNVTASPSASTFQLNGISSTNVKVYNVTGAAAVAVTVASTNPTAGTSPSITITNNSGSSIAGNSTIKIFLGCTTLTGSSCTTQDPRILNPTKSSTAGTANSYKVTLAQTGVGADTTTISIATIESVTVRATVDPTLSFTIAGLSSASDLAAGNLGCSAGTFGQTVNTGIASSATDVNLGIVQQTPNTTGGNIPNITGQLLTITTNGATGYSLTATASSSLLNPATGYYFNANTSPTTFPGTGGIGGKYHYFGLHPCGSDVDTSWANGGGAGSAACTLQTGVSGTNCKFVWPSADANPGTTPITIASNPVGPIGTGNGNTGLVSVAYAAGSDVNVPPGQYRTVITYVATPMF